MPNGPPSRFEFSDLQHRVEQIDQRGTSGAASFQTRLEAVEHDLEALQRDRAEEKKERRVTRRWIVGVALTAVAVSVGLATFLGTFIFHARH